MLVVVGRFVTICWIGWQVILLNLGRCEMDTLIHVISNMHWYDWLFVGYMAFLGAIFVVLLLMAFFMQEK
jgi:hypothetical protein